METSTYHPEGPKDFQEALERGDIIHIINLPLGTAGQVMDPTIRRFNALEFKKLEAYGDHVIISRPLAPEGIEKDPVSLGIFIRQEEAGLRGFYVPIEDFRRIQSEQQAVS